MLDDPITIACTDTQRSNRNIYHAPFVRIRHLWIRYLYHQFPVRVKRNLSIRSITFLMHPHAFPFSKKLKVWRRPLDLRNISKRAYSCRDHQFSLLFTMLELLVSTASSKEDNVAWSVRSNLFPPTTFSIYINCCTKVLFRVSVPKFFRTDHRYTALFSKIGL